MWVQVGLVGPGAPKVLAGPGDLLREIETWGNGPGGRDYLADLTGKAPKEFGLDGVGFWPAVVQEVSLGAGQVLNGTYSVGDIDAEARQVQVIPNVRDMTPAELESRVAELVAFANQWQWAYATGGFKGMIGGTPVEFATDVGSLGLMTGKAVRFQQPGAPGSVRWQVGPTSFVTIEAQDFAALAAKIADFVQATFGVLETVLDGIQGGSVATQEAIMGAEWPANGQ